MTILTTIPNGAGYKDIRDTWNSLLTRVTTLEQTPAAPSLGVLGLSSTALTIGTPANGAIVGATTGSTIGATGLTGTGVTINGASRTWAYDGSGTAGSSTITLTETLSGASNTPRSSSITVTRSAGAPTLGALTLSGTLQVGTAASGTISGATAGSTIAGNIPGITVNSAARTYSGTPSGAAGAIANGLVETLAGATGSPRSSSVTVAMASATTGIVYDGDSITEGPNQSWFRGLPSRPSIFTNTTGQPTVNLGVSGRFLQDMDSTFGSRNVAGNYSAASANTLILLGGVNDIINNGATLAQLQGWMTSYCGKATAASFRLFVGTILPTAYTGWTSTMETIRTNFNTWLKNNKASLGLADVIDYAAIPEAADPTNTAYYFDKLHPYQRLLGIMSRLDATVTGVAVTQIVINPDFSTGLGDWFGYAYNFSNASPYIHSNDAVMSNPSGRLRITCPNGSTDNYAEAHLPLTGLVAGAVYTFSYDLIGYDGKTGDGGAGGGARIRVASVQGQSITDSSTAFAYSDGSGSGQVKTSPGTYTGNFTATAATMFLVIQNYSQTTAAYVDVDNVHLTKN